MILTVDVEEYLAEAKKALKEFDGTEKEYTSLLEKKMRVSPTCTDW